MQTEMRRKDRKLTEEETRSVLEKCQYGILSVITPEGEPYGVPVSYVALDGIVYFHCGMTGKRIDSITANPAVSFTVVGDTEPVFGPGYSTYYESCIIAGTVREITDPEKKCAVLRALVERYLPAYTADIDKELKKEKITRIFAIDPSHMTGKAKKKPA